MSVTAEYLDELIPENAHALLKAVYQCPEVPLSVRMRAAMICLPFETPKLAVTAQVSEGNFADLLDRRLKHLDEMRLIEQKTVEQSNTSSQHSTNSEPVEKPPIDLAKPTTPAPLNRLYDKRHWRRF